MLYRIFFLLVLLLTPRCLVSATKEPKNVGVCITATGRYYQFVAPLIASARTNFLPGHNITFFVFTDGPIPTGEDIVRIEQGRLGWPYDTMMRFEFYAKNKEIFEGMDYLYALDADMRIVDTVDSRILGDLVATRHPGFTRQRGSYETNPQSLAYVSPEEGKYYFCGGVWGGSKKIFIQACEELNKRIHIDLSHDIIAVWHDESHLNRYLIDNPPTVVLSPSYCYPESWNIPYKKRILALDKNHSEFQIPK